jgi:hypothetical protein
VSKPRWQSYAERKAARQRAEEAAAVILARGAVVPPEEELARVAELLAGHSWTFAKSMAENPHHYTLRKNWADDAEFIFVVQRIYEWGYVERWPDPVRSWPYICLDVDEFHYWPMGSGEDCILINRKPLTPPPIQPTLFDMET